MAYNVVATLGWTAMTAILIVQRPDADPIVQALWWACGGWLMPVSLARTVSELRRRESAAQAPFLPELPDLDPQPEADQGGDHREHVGGVVLPVGPEVHVRGDDVMHHRRRAAEPDGTGGPGHHRDQPPGVRDGGHDVDQPEHGDAAVELRDEHQRQRPQRRVDEHHQVHVRRAAG